jgi:hypothetical protein
MERRKGNNLWGHLIVSLVAISIFVANISDSGLWHPDAPSHALNGVFYGDMIEEKGFFHPKSYAERYYVQYPSLTIGMYPPIFYSVAALFFKVFGVSPLIAKLPVLFFTLVGVNGFLLLCKQWFPLWLSVTASILYLLQPAVLFGQTNVMLEMPALAVSILSLYCLYVGTEKDNPWALFVTPLVAALAFLTKQNTVFLIPIWLVWIIADKKRSIIKSRHFMTGALIGTLILIPWLVVNLTVGRSYVVAFAFRQYHVWSNFLYYVRHASEVVSPPVIVLFILSVGLFMKSKKYNGYRFSLVWGCSVLLSLLIMEYSEPRYAMFLVPPMIILSMHTFLLLREKSAFLIQRKRISAIAMVLLISLHLHPGEVLGGRDIQGFDDAADFVVRDTGCVSVLYDGYFNGNFIFHMRARDKVRRIFVFRASKLVFTTKMLLELGYNELVSESSDFYDVLNRHSIKYIVQEERDLMRAPANKRLREWVGGSEFRLVQRIPVYWRHFSGFGDLLVYEYLNYEAKPIGQVDLSMPMLGGSISVKVDSGKENVQVSE